MQTSVVQKQMNGYIPCSKKKQKQKFVGGNEECCGNGDQLLPNASVLIQTNGHRNHKSHKAYISRFDEIQYISLRNLEVNQSCIFGVQRRNIHAEFRDFRCACDHFVLQKVIIKVLEKRRLNPLFSSEIILNSCLKRPDSSWKQSCRYRITNDATRSSGVSTNLKNVRPTNFRRPD